MFTRNFFLFSLLLTFMLCAEDVAKPTLKKEKIPAIPHMWISGGILCLQAQNDGLSFANTDQSIPSAYFINPDTHNPHFSWDTGVRIEVGYQPRDWFYFGNWTFIQNTAYGSKSTDGQTGFFPVLSLNSTQSPSTYVTSAKLKWKLNTNLIDLGAIYSWNPNKYFLLKNIAGLRFASLNQRANVFYGGGNFNQGLDSLQLRNNFFGVGPSIGLSPNIILGQGFSLIGYISSSALLGHFFVQEKEKYLTQHLYYQTNNMTRFRFTLDAKASLAWQKEFLYKALVFSAQLGWEWHEFFSQNQLRYNGSIFAPDSRNILLQGAFLALCIGF